MPRPIRLLEVGCGTGRNLKPFLRPEFRVYGVDKDVDASATAKSLVSGDATAGPFFTVAHAGKLPFAGGSFDTVLCLDMLHWAVDSREFNAWWREIWRMLKPGGFLIARFRCRDDSPSDAGKKSDSGRWFLADPVQISGLVREGKGEWLEPWRSIALPGGGWQGNVWVRRKRRKKSQRG